MVPTLFRAARCRLTAMRPDDARTASEWFASSAFSRMLDGSTAFPRGEAEMARLFGETHDGKNNFTFAVRPLDGDQLIGFCALDGILWNHGSAWLTIAIGEGFQGQGYGQEALAMLLDFAFDELNLHRLQLSVFAYNTRAIRLYEQLGFVREGAQRELLHRGGQRHDLLFYGILRREWESRGAATP